jgi:serine/threonine protein kinase
MPTATIMATRRLGRYQVLKHLASGGMADVLLARADGVVEGFERHVVIKRIRAEQARDPQFINMFLDEARLAARLHHQNVIQVHDIGEDEGDYFFTMEYLHGEDLRRLLMAVSRRKEKVPLEHVITIVTGAAAGLHHAHEQRDSDGQPLGIVHRDVSPSNIMVGYDGSVKVTDFGIAKATNRTAQTETGARKGKLSYMSPEQCLGKAIDRRSDVFALGIVLYELVTARRLFKFETDYLVMTAIVHGAIQPPSRLRPDIPPQLDEIILKALARKPSDRYQTAAELQTALEAFAREFGLRTSPLAGYMNRVFGERPLPWRVDGEPEREPDIDFDGSASAVVELPDALALPDSFTPAPSSPFARARAKHITGSPELARPAPGAASASTSVEPKRRWGIVIGIAMSLVIFIAIMLATRSSGTDAGTAPPPAEAPPPAASEPVAVPAPDRPAPAEAPAIDVKAVDTPAPKADPRPAPTVTPPAAAPKPEVKKPVRPKIAPSRPTADPKKADPGGLHYDPKSLFPK